MSYLKGTDINLAQCHYCHSILKMESSNTRFCPVCHSTVSLRKKQSLSRTWAWLLTAVFFYIPANFLPVMTVASLGHNQSDTILSGVMHLLEGGMWPLALIVFVASIFVPVLKLTVLVWLLISVQARSSWRPEDRTRYYRITEFVGRWSMVDIFVIAILTALVQFGELAHIEVGSGSIAFAMVVIFTMLAANSFDPRLIWDACETRKN